jgi:hypothetical protein
MSNKPLNEFKKLKDEIRDKMSKIFVRISKNSVGLESTGDKSKFLSNMLNKRQQFKKKFNNKEYTNNFIEKLKSSNSILKNFNLENKSQNILINKYNKIIKIFDNNDDGNENLNKSNFSNEFSNERDKFEKQFEEQFKKQSERQSKKEDNINKYKLSSIKKININNSNNLNKLLDYSIIIKECEVEGLNNNEEIEVIYNSYPSILYMIQYMPENRKKFENNIHLARGRKYISKLYNNKYINKFIVGENTFIKGNYIKFESMPDICIVSDKLYNKLLNIINKKKNENENKKNENEKYGKKENEEY